MCETNDDRFRDGSLHDFFEESMNQTSATDETLVVDEDIDYCCKKEITVIVPRDQCPSSAASCESRSEDGAAKSDSDMSTLNSDRSDIVIVAMESVTTRPFEARCSEDEFTPLPSVRSVSDVDYGDDDVEVEDADSAESEEEEELNAEDNDGLSSLEGRYDSTSRPSIQETTPVSDPFSRPGLDTKTDDSSGRYTQSGDGGEKDETTDCENDEEFDDEDKILDDTSSVDESEIKSGDVNLESHCQKKQDFVDRSFKSTIPFTGTQSMSERSKPCSAEGPTQHEKKRDKYTDTPMPIDLINPELADDASQCLVRDTTALTGICPAILSFQQTSTDTPLTQGANSRLYSTELENTPTLLPREGTRTNDSGAASGNSDTSGRKNPQAKFDTEVRGLEKSRVAVQIMHPNLRTKHSVLPSIARGISYPPDTGLIRRTRGVVKTDQQHLRRDIKSTLSPGSQEPQKRLTRKPHIPHQLSAAAFFHEGKVDVSILGDEQFLQTEDPLKVNITFINKSQTAKSAKPVGNNKVKVVKRSTSSNPRKATQTSNKTVKLKELTNRSNPAKKNQNVAKERLPPLKRVNHLQKSTKSKPKPNDLRKKTRKTINAHAPNQALTGGLNWNIIEHRAMWPPFNTHINPEASSRFQKLFGSI